MMFPESMYTDRLRLRRWLKSDLEPFAALNSDPRVMEHFPSPVTRQASDAMAARIQQHFADHGFGWWAVEVQGINRFAGFIGLGIPRIEAHFTPCVEIGWRLATEYWGCGYATEGAMAALDFAFSLIQLEEVVAVTAVGNQRSRRVMDKIGMNHSPFDDFNHPMIPEQHIASRHVLYRITAQQFRTVRR